VRTPKRRLERCAIALLGCVLGLTAAGTAEATSFALAAEPPRSISFELDIEFDDGVTGTFADVEVSEDGLGLRFEIALRDPLGPGADLREFYFNLTDEIGPLQIESDDPVTTAYVLSLAGPVGGGAGSRFDYEVSFGNGAGRPGNGVLKTASFLIEPADSVDPLSLDALLGAELSAAAGGMILVNAAAHIQGTSLVRGATSETIGGTVPEPTTGILLTSGLLLALRGSRARRR
jgi:hypothetical protein